jgi:hypothetical protein
MDQSTTQWSMKNQFGGWGQLLEGSQLLIDNISAVYTF